MNPKKGMPRALVSLAVCTAAAVAAIHDAGAIGFGRVRGGAVLGQPLDIAVPLRLEDGETIAPECVAAEVISGEQRVAPAAVRARLEPSPGGGGEHQLRITTQSAIDEPVIDITVTVGCGSRVSRRFVAFADPPGASPASLVAAEPSSAAPLAAPVAEPAPQRPRAVAAPRRAVPAASVSPKPAVRPPRVAAAPPRQAAPRLQLEATEPVSSPALAAASVEAQPPAAKASAARTAASAAETASLAANERIRALEAELARLRSEAQAQREALLQMRSRVAERELGGALLPWLLAIVALLAALALWLGLRTRRLAREREPWWTSQLSTHAAESGFDPRGALPSVQTTGNAVFDPVARPRAGSPPPIDTAPGALQASAPSVFAPDRHAVTVEEQIDLEQQADFFIVLGQDEAAIALLLTHLRGTGGTSPMPYLKLLEIYRRTGDREAYERTRIRFNQRFNGVAPAWDTDPEAGRTLEDYPQVLQRLQQSWWSPLDAMAELESMLFRRGDDAELFDLPAYQEVLFLYQLARDMNLHEKPEREAPKGEVDVLLPIDSDSTRGGLSVRHVDVERTSVLGPTVVVPVPLDIDLSEPASAAPAQRAPRDDRFLDFGDSQPPR